MSRDASTGQRRRRLRVAFRILGLLVAGLFVLVLPAGARDHAAAELAAAAGRDHVGGRAGGDRGVRRARRTRARATSALAYAWSTAATIEPWAEGKNFFPRIFADVEAARSSVHILMFGWREGEVGTEMADLLKRKLAEGVEVRVIVDGFGSQAVRPARADVHAPRRRRRADRRQRRLSRSTGTASTPTAAPRLAPGRGRPGRPPQALRDRRRGRVDRRRRASRTTSRTAASTT